MRGNLWAESTFRIEADVLSTGATDYTLCNGEGQVRFGWSHRRQRERPRERERQHLAVIHRWNAAFGNQGPLGVETGRNLPIHATERKESDR